MLIHLLVGRASTFARQLSNHRPAVCAASAASHSTSVAVCGSRSPLRRCHAFAAASALSAKRAPAQTHANAVARIVYLHRSAQRTPQPLRLHHTQLHIVLPDDHAAAVYM